MARQVSQRFRSRATIVSFADDASSATCSCYGNNENSTCLGNGSSTSDHLYYFAKPGSCGAADKVRPFLSTRKKVNADAHPPLYTGLLSAQPSIAILDGKDRVLIFAFSRRRKEGMQMLLLLIELSPSYMTISVSYTLSVVHVMDIAAFLTLVFSEVA